MNKEKIAVFPGSFDPFTRGHQDIVLRALPLFDTLIIAIGENQSKKYLFDLEQRTNWIKAVFVNQPKVQVAHYEGLTVDFCLKVGATFIVRGLRSSPDFEFEKNIAQLNFKLKGLDSLFFLSKPEYTAISSTIVRDIYRNGGDIKDFIPEQIKL